MHKELVDAIVASLRGNPEEWEFTGFSLYNSQKKTRVWVGNGRSFVDVVIDDETILGSNMALIPLASWRWRIWSAAKTVMRRPSIAERKVRALVETYWLSQA